MQHHCKSQQTCSNCGSVISFEAYSKDGETLKELEIRVIRGLKESRELHLQSPLCPKKIRIVTGGFICNRCDKKIEVVQEILENQDFKYNDKDAVRILKEGNAREYVKEIIKHQDSCYKSSVKTRSVILEKNVKGRK